MKKNKKSVLKAITTLALVFAMVAGITAGFKGKAKASRPGYYNITFNGGSVAYNQDGKPQNGSVKKPGGQFVSSYTVEYPAGTKFGFPAAQNGKYECIGYTTKKNGTKPEYKPGDVLYASGNYTYYAVWKQINVTYYVGENGCYPLTSKGYIYDRDNDGIADRQGTDSWIGGKDTFAKASRVHLDKNNRYWNYKGFICWRAKRGNSWVNVSNMTVQQALNAIGDPNATSITVYAYIDYEPRK